MEKLWIAGIQCAELRKPDLKNCSLEYIKNAFTSHTRLDCFFDAFAFMLQGWTLVVSVPETGGYPQSNFSFLFHSNQFLIGHMWAFWIDLLMGREVGVNAEGHPVLARSPVLIWKLSMWVLA